MESIFKKTFTVTNNQLDKNDHLTLSSILDYIQEVSGNHADTMKCGFDDLIAKNLIWVVVRHHIEFYRHLHVGKYIDVETYPLKRRFVEYPRETKIYDNNELILAAHTTWVILDLKTFNFTTNDFVPLEYSNTPSFFDTKFKRIPKKNREELTFVKTAEVMYSMLDHNGHMNNSRYLTWFLDIFEEPRDPKSFQIEYLKQSFSHEKIDLYVHEEHNSKELYGFGEDGLKFYCKAEYED